MSRNTSALSISLRVANRRSGLTLLEMMVAITLLAVIMIGLLAMFQQTQRALHVAHTQTDLFENARGAIQLIARDFSEMAAYGDTNVYNALFAAVASPVGTLSLPSAQPPLPAVQQLELDEVYWLTHVNDEWQGLGYYVGDDPVRHNNVGVGTLYRFSLATNRTAVPSLLNYFSNPNVLPAITNHRVSDGVVHFAVQAVYVTLPPPPNNTPDKQQFVRAPTLIPNFPNFRFPLDESNTLPAYVDIELGVMEPATLKQFQSLTGNVVIAQQFLREHEGRIHFFRERVPIRNFVNPYRSDEVP